MTFHIFFSFSNHQIDIQGFYKFTYEIVITLATNVLDVYFLSVKKLLLYRPIISNLNEVRMHKTPSSLVLLL